MKKWLGPAAVALLTAAAAWHGGLALMTYGLMELAIQKTSAQSGLNHMFYTALSSPENQPVVRPSPDLSYSACAYDLTNGPVQVTMTPFAGHYSSLSVFDARTDVAFVRNDLQTKGKPFSIVIARDGQAVPAGVEAVRVKYDRGLALVRVLLNDPSEIKSLEPVRRQSSCRQI